MVGTQSSQRVNKTQTCVHFQFVFFSLYLSLLLPSCSSLLSTPSLFRPPIGPSLSLSLSSLSPSLSLWPSSSSACLGKADCGIPGKPLREWLAGGGGGGGEHLTQHIYSTVDILVAYFERRTLHLFYIFLTVDRKSTTSSPGCFQTSLWHVPPPFRKFYASQMTIFITHPS